MAHNGRMSSRILLVRLLAAAALAASLAPSRAQTAAELVVVAALSASLDPSIRLPRGAAYYINPENARRFSAYLGADAAKYTDYQLYVATGLAAKLGDAYVHNLETGFAAAGYFRGATTTYKAGPDTVVRSEFDNGEKTLVLVVVRQGDSVFFLSGRKI